MPPHPGPRPFAWVAPVPSEIGPTMGQWCRILVVVLATVVLTCTCPQGPRAGHPGTGINALQWISWWAGAASFERVYAFRLSNLGRTSWLTGLRTCGIGVRLCVMRWRVFYPYSRPNPSMLTVMSVHTCMPS